MKLYLVTIILSICVVSIQSRPQTVHPEHRASSDVLKLPFYGGARGQILEIRKNSDGTVISKILKGEEEEMELKVHQIVDEIKKHDEIYAEDDENKQDNPFEDYLKNIQKAASTLVALQENVKKTGKLSGDQKKLYTDNLEKLGVAAQKLAQIQQDDNEDKDDIRLLFDKEFDMRTSDPVKKAAQKLGGSFPGFKAPTQEKKKIENKKKEKEEEEEEEENVGEQEEESNNESEAESDSVQVNVPDKESSIAEAKPVGLAIAGIGGVASSKPVATAVVGDGGLAVARPVATAIAGIKPSELGSLGIPIPSGIHKKISGPRGKYGLIESAHASAGVLIGPEYTAEARASSSGIDAEIDDARQNSIGGQNNVLSHNFDSDKFLANLRFKSKLQPQVQRIPYQQQLQQQQQQQQLQQQYSAPNYAFSPDYLNQNQYSIYQPNYTPYYNWNPSMYSPLAYQQYQQLSLPQQLAQYGYGQMPQYDTPALSQRSYYNQNYYAYPMQSMQTMQSMPSFSGMPSTPSMQPFRYYFY